MCRFGLLSCGPKAGGWILGDDMSLDRDLAYWEDLVLELRRLPRETEWVEFKVDNQSPQMIGQNISALANAAALANRDHAYLVWGVENDTHAVVGTKFSPAEARKGKEPLEAWLLRVLTPRPHIRFHEVPLDGQRLVILEIGRATHQPVAFEGREFIRVGPTTRGLREFPEKERVLWRAFDRGRFEEGIAAGHVSGEEVLRLLDYPKYFQLLDIPPADGRAATLEVLRQDRLIARGDAGGFDITNLGAILLANRLRDFDRLERKIVRIIEYRGPGRTDALREKEGAAGYATGFDGLMNHIGARLPESEVIEGAFRRTIVDYPPPAVRELLANALIHQDFSMTGAGPMVEIFEGRLEITNPGEPLVDTRRFLDGAPRSRNERLASLMRRFELCEERGTGIDKVVTEVERHQLPAPRFEKPPNFTRVVLFARRKLAEMDREERIRACYQHACLKWVSGGFLTNASLRERFGIVQNNRSVVSRYIREAVKAGAIEAFDETAPPRFRKYIPYWVRADPTNP